MPYRSDVTIHSPGLYLMILIIMLCSIIVAIVSIVRSGAPMFEYKTMQVESLDKMGRTEWDLVSCDGRVCIFKRRVSP